MIPGQWESRMVVSSLRKHFFYGIKSGSWEVNAGKVNSHQKDVFFFCLFSIPFCLYPKLMKKRK